MWVISLIFPRTLEGFWQKAKLSSRHRPSKKFMFSYCLRKIFHSTVRHKKKIDFLITCINGISSKITDDCANAAVKNYRRLYYPVLTFITCYYSAVNIVAFKNPVHVKCSIWKISYLHFQDWKDAIKMLSSWQFRVQNFTN